MRVVGLRGGFTLVEIVVGVAIISTLMGLMLPAVGAARHAARRAACAATQERLYQATMAYSLSDDGWLPGVNRTGLKYRASIQATQSLEGDTTPGTPTTTYDWISPVIGFDVGLSANRARRTKQIFEDLGCLEAQRPNDQTFGYSNDLTSDFVPLLKSEGIGQISYLAPAPFQLAGPAWSPTQYERFGWTGPATPPPRYLPRLENIGKQPATKVFVADGTRYLSAGNVLDFDVSPNPDYYGSFTSSTPIYAGSTAYGSGPAGPGFDVSPGGLGADATRRKLSYRHAGGLNVIYFDGHYGTMTEDESKTNAAPWCPSGSTFTGVYATEQSLGRHQVGAILN